MLALQIAGEAGNQRFARPIFGGIQDTQFPLPLLVTLIPYLFDHWKRLWKLGVCLLKGLLQVQALNLVSCDPMLPANQQALASVWLQEQA